LRSRPPSLNAPEGWCATTMLAAAAVLVISACADDPLSVLKDDSSRQALSLSDDVLVSDGFNRTISRGWGDPDVGGSWTVSDPADFSVRNGNGFITKFDHASRRVLATAGNGVNVYGSTSFKIDTPPDNPRRFYTVQVYARLSDVGNYYRFRLRAFGDGRMDLRVEAGVDGDKWWVTDVIPVSVSWAAGNTYRIRWETTGTSPSTTLRMQVWREGGAQPGAWDLDATVDLPRLDLPGTTGIRVSGPSADQFTFPVTFSFDDIEYRATDSLPENHAPVADAGGPYTGTAGVAIQVDGSGSSDPDGDTPLTYAWDLGDGSSASGVAPTHTYAAAGIYTVTLVVTDSRGLASEPTTTTATIGAANDLSGILVRDTFSRTTTSGWGTPDIGAGWHFGSADPADFRVENGRGYVIKHDNAMRNAVAREGASTEGYGLNVQGIASFRIDTPPDNPNRFYTVQVYARRDDRVSDGDNYYRYRVRAYGRGDMDVRIEKNVNGSSSWITPNTDIDATWEVGQKYWIRWEAAGTSPGTRIRMRVWKDATPEPSAWNLDITVDEPALDVIGTTGFRVSGPSNDQTTFPVVFALDDLEYREID
jgi:PKD repeat protein